MKKTILICENDEDIIHVSKIILERNNYAVAVCTTTEDLFLRIDHIKPCLILLDIWIGSMGGEEVTLRLKTNPATSGIPVILFSANVEIEKIAHRAKADGFLAKPFDVSELLDVVTRHCS